MEDINTLILKHTGKTVLPKQTTYLDEWGQWYKGNVKNFHYYRLYNGQTHLNLTVKSMQMAKFISETWADLLLNEKTQIVLPEAAQEKFDTILKNNNFWYKANNGLEKSFALGLGAYVIGVKDIGIGDKGSINKEKARISIDFIDRYKIQHITIENGIVTECAFIYKNSDSTILIMHLIENNRYYIHNYTLKETSYDYYYFDTKSETPLFQIVMPNIANNLNDDLTNEEIGISVFANAIDGLQDLDMKYDSFYNEGILKRTRTYVSGDAYRVDVDSNQRVKVWDPLEQIHYYTGNNDDGTPKVDTKDYNLQYEEHIKGINAQLNYVGMKCGFGQSFFKFDGTAIMTATQVKSENNSLARRIVKHEIKLEDVLYNLTKAIIHISNEFTNNPIGQVEDKEINIIFDDSVIEDKEAMMKRDKEDVAAGLMSREEYRIKWYGEDEKTAYENVRKYFLNEIIDDYLPALTQGGMTPEQYVLKVYGEIDNKEEVINYITNFINQGNINDFDPELYTDKE